jgi:hypothetical protein
MIAETTEMLRKKIGGECGGGGGRTRQRRMIWCHQTSDAVLI